MGFMDDLKGWFRKESADAKAWADEAVADGNSALDRAERRLSADPEERLAASVEATQANDDAFAAIRAKADAATARPQAEGEVDEAEGAAEAEAAGEADHDPGPATG